jgi:predicted AAA+ superfamily ATPase
VHRNTLTQYFHILEEAKITQNLFSDSFGITALQKPEKIYLENSNFIYALDQHQPNIGNIRETFFANQLSYKHRVTYSKEADFLIDGKLTFEIGGQKKSQKQISQTPDAYIAADDIEIGYKNKIPLWLFGFLY